MNKKIQKATKVLQKNIGQAQKDPRRPGYHFLPPANWMNDPNGTIFHNGAYHLFYQFNPAKPKWGNLHWGHAKSQDLVHWEHQPIALAPDGFPHELHCWSGCCVIADDGTPTLFYTSMNLWSLLARAKRYSQQWMATGSPDLTTWTKHPANPVLSESVHSEQTPYHWRDPFIWKHENQWYMILAGQFPGEKFGSVLLYQSTDLENWAYLGVLCAGNESQGKGWECPNYAHFEEKSVLIISPYGPVIYSIGEFDGKHHHTKAWHTLDYGKDFYATNTYIDDQGRTIVVGWVKAKGDGWSGCLSLPREIKPVDGNQLRITPVTELKDIRTHHQRYERKLETLVEIAGTAPLYGDRVEIQANYELQNADSVGFKLIDDEDEHILEFNLKTKDFQAIDERVKLEFAGDSNSIDLHIFIDKSVIEIFINQKECFTVCFYPKLGENHALKIAPFVTSGIGKFSIDFWRLEKVID